MNKIDNITKNIGSDLIKLKLDGFSMSEMYEFTKEKYPDCSYHFFFKIYSELMLEIVQKSSDLAISVINDHILRYEKIYNFFINHEFFEQAKKTLELKEKLLGFHSDIYHFEVNNILNKEDLEQREFDFNLLSKEEKKIFFILIEKAKIVNDKGE